MSDKIEINPVELERMYHEENMSQKDISEELGCGASTVSRRIEEYGLRRERGAVLRIGLDKNVLEKLYWEDGLTMDEISSELDTTVKVVFNNFRRYEIPTRDEGPRGNKYPTIGYYGDEGRETYEYIYADENLVRHHRLLMVAEHGFDAVCDNVVHHENEIPWDNRPSNLTLMSRGEHRTEHERRKHESGYY